MSLTWQELFEGSMVGSDSCVAFCNQHAPLVLACLPFALSELAGRSSFNDMFELVNKVGGRKIYLPKFGKNFAETFGIALEESIYQRWRQMANQHGQIEIPSKWGVFLTLRRVAIYTAIQNGLSNEELTITFGITQRQLRNMRVKLNVPFER